MPRPHLSFLSATAFWLLLTTLSAQGQVAIQPYGVTLGPSQAQQFMVQSNGVSMPAAWSINPTDVGSISASGLYTAPATIVAQSGRGQVRRHDSLQSVTITAVLTINGAATTTSTAVFLDPKAITGTVSVSLNPSSVPLGAGKS